jgi:hypothetical protein
MRYEEATRAELPAYKGVYNVGLFIALLEQDISAFNESIFSLQPLGIVNFTLADSLFYCSKLRRIFHDS